MTTRNATRSGNVGKAMPGFEVTLAQDGEILIKGNNFMGYLNKAEQTEAVLREGWCHTGDKGRWQYDNLVLSEYQNDPSVIPGDQKNYRII
jgi:long-chain acyl-CoA synthetase